MVHTTQLSRSLAPRPGGQVVRFAVPLVPQLRLDRLLWPERHIAYQLLTGAAAIGATAALGAPFLSGMERGGALFIFFPAVFLAALFGRLAGGMFAATLSILAVSVWTAPVQGAANLTGTLPFAAACATVIFLAEALHRVHGQAFAAALESAEAKRCAAVLGEREAWLNAVLDGVADGIVTIDERGTIISINPAVTAIFGYRPEEVTGQSVNMLMPEFCRGDDYRYIAEHLRVRARSNGQPPAAGRGPPQGRLGVPDGLRRDRCPLRRQAPVRRHRPRHNRAGDGGASAEGQRGISRTVLESSADCIEVLDSAGRIEYVNGEGLRLLKTAGLAAATGGRWLDIWPERDRRPVESAIARANAGETSRFSACLPAAKGSPKHWDVLVAPVHDSEGRIRKLVATARDITEAKEAEEQIKLLMHEVNHRSKNLFAGCRP